MPTPSPSRGLVVKSDHNDERTHKVLKALASQPRLRGERLEHLVGAFVVVVGFHHEPARWRGGRHGLVSSENDLRLKIKD